MADTDKKKKRGCFFRFSVVFIIVVAAFYLLMVISMADVWFFFGDKRTAEIEKNFGITLPEGVKIKKYERISGQGGGVYRLYLSGISDMESFCRGCTDRTVELMGTTGGVIEYGGMFAEEEEYAAEELKELLRPDKVSWYPKGNVPVFYCSFVPDEGYGGRAENRLEIYGFEITNGYSAAMQITYGH